MKVLIGIMVSTIILVSSARASLESFDQEVENLLKPERGKYGQIKFSTRYRYQYVDQDNVSTITETANASTIRLRLGYLTPEIGGLQGFAEYEGVGAVFNKHKYNSTRNGDTRFPVVADPTKSEVNQLWIGYSGIPDTLLKAGRQRMTYDNQRFIGNVGWRQLEQTFDSGTIVNQSLPDTIIRTTYIWRVKDVTSEEVKMSSPLVNLSYEGLDFGKLTGYGYWLDYSDSGNSAGFTKSSKTFGVRFDGATPISDRIQALYTAEYAHQSDFQRNPENYDTQYLHVVGGLGFNRISSLLTDLSFKVGWEQLGTDKGVSFQTPLGTLHAFQGWADKFLITPRDGIEDLYASIEATVKGVKLLAVYHEFNAATGGDHYGRELDALIVKEFGKHYALTVKYAFYDARALFTDTEKIWLQFDVTF